ncbi:MAG: TIM barrel protein [Candidatus Latescibacterota bacterium]
MVYPADPQVLLSGFADEGPPDKKAESQLTMLAALGMSYYSLRFVDVGQGVRNVMQLTAAEVRDLAQRHRDLGIRVSSLGSPLGKVKLRDVEDGTSNRYVPFPQYLAESVARAVELAGELATRLIRGFSFYHPRGTPPEEHLSQAADQLAAIAAVCGRAGVVYGVEVEANLVGQNGHLLRHLYDRVGSPHLLLVFDGGNLACQNLTPSQILAEYRAMQPGLGWLHIKDYRVDPSLQWHGHVDEERLRNFVPADRGDAGHEAILRDFRQHLPALTARLGSMGVPGVFLDLEPHLRGGGQFGGFSGVDGFGVALRCLLRLLDFVGIGYRLTDYADIEAQKGG